eukprot:1141729-Pelagomonas_calceolata.AAC.3
MPALFMKKKRCIFLAFLLERHTCSSTAATPVPGSAVLQIHTFFYAFHDTPAPPPRAAAVPVTGSAAAAASPAASAAHLDPANTKHKSAEVTGKLHPAPVPGSAAAAPSPAAPAAHPDFANTKHDYAK